MFALLAMLQATLPGHYLYKNESKMYIQILEFCIQVQRRFSFISNKSCTLDILHSFPSKIISKVINTLKSK